MAVGLQEGFEDVLFVVCFIFSIIICYDACGVRLHAGRTAEALNRRTTSRTHWQRSQRRPAAPIACVSPLAAGLARFRPWLRACAHSDPWRAGRAAGRSTSCGRPTRWRALAG